jgi:hypothetical protein
VFDEARRRHLALIDRPLAVPPVVVFLTVIRDTRDDAVEPSRGVASANGQIAARAVGSEIGS